MQPKSYTTILIVGILILLWWVGAWGIAEAGITYISEKYNIDQIKIYIGIVILSTILLDKPFNMLHSALAWSE